MTDRPCPRCDDTGVVRRELAGRAIERPCVLCRRYDALEFLRKQRGSGDPMEDSWAQRADLA